ncbi:MAG: 4-hydroxybenzoate octaprenyltransferase [Gammaproteobacteria bacterium]|nr:4-hydroxybenzoate octaprenyltransferase [Gammaproteobacteria bacterium]MDX2487669.1 4-hydroxybenzoate octaprenyltransferase [Gammaproteobacteria bacterium]
MTSLAEKIKQYLLLMRADRPIGSFLLLWPSLWSLWLAGEGQPTASIVLIFIVGVFVMRSAGCVINDFADRHIDPDVARTCSRPIAAGLVKPREALILFATLCGIAFLLVLQLNTLSIKLSFVAVFLAASYPFMKRVTHLPQAYLGMAFGWSIPMAFAAQSGQLPAAVWLLFVANIFWTIAYDTMYAMVDRDDDTKIGVMSTAILFGSKDRQIIGLLQLSTLLMLTWAGLVFERGSYYYFSLLFASSFFIYQQWLIAERDPARCLQAFLNNNWFGAAVFIGLLLDYLP